MKGIADTGFLVAFANASDRHHDWAVSVARRVAEPLLTCEAVLAEASFHLGSVALVLEMIETGLVRLAFHCDEHRPHLAAMAGRYRDRSPDLADLCVIRMSELYPKHTVLTVDREDFAVYRRNRREVIPTCMPPADAR
jgi:predicted nucleic acid-binding protein